MMALNFCRSALSGTFASVDTANFAPCLLEAIAFTLGPKTHMLLKADLPNAAHAG